MVPRSGWPQEGTSRMIDKYLDELLESVGVDWRDLSVSAYEDARQILENFGEDYALGYN